MSLHKTLTLDVETGGLNNRTAGLCSVTMKKYGAHTPVTWYVKPNIDLEYGVGALKVHGLTKSFLEERGLSEGELCTCIIDYVKNHFSSRPHPLGHNVVFDIGFLNELFKRNNYELSDLFHYHIKDSMVAAGFLRDAGLLDVNSVSLTNVYQVLFGIELEGAHSSEADVLATEKVYNELLRLVK